MRKRIIVLRNLFFTCFIFIGCIKQVPTFSNEQGNVINEIKKIVGSKGRIEVLEAGKYYDNLLGLTIDSLQDHSKSVRYLSLTEFKFIYEKMQGYQYQRVAKNENNSSYRKMDYEEEEPGKPGLHRISFYAFPLNTLNGTSGINNSNTLFTTMNLWYETNVQGMVIGNPIIFYSGVTFLQNWTQLYVTEIQYNASNNTSTFTIAGSTLYGISISGQNIGWSSPNGYNISINMSSNFGADGNVKLIGWN
jgi:hypothetical protein